MKEITILISNIAVKNKTNSFILSLIDSLYKKNIKIIVYSNKFPKDFYAYITKKHLSLNFTNIKEIAYQSKNSDALIAIDFPMNVIAYKIKNVLKKIEKKTPIIIWYSINFQDFLYLQNNNNKLIKKISLKNDYKSIHNMDIILCSRDNVKDKIIYIYDNINSEKKINILRPYYSPYINNSVIEKENYILTFFNAENSIYKVTSAYSEYIQNRIKNKKEIYKLKIIGYNKYLEDNINKLKINDYVELLDYSKDTQLIIKKAYIIIIHSTKDPFYIELISAWHNKTAAIVDSKTSSSEIISIDRKNALIYSHNNPISLYNQLVNIIDNKKLYNSISSSIENIPNIEDTSNNLLEIIKNNL